jgi:hypothetical protein
MATHLCELCDFDVLSISESLLATEPSSKPLTYRTTEAVIDFLGLESRNPLDKARRSNSGFYKCDRYVVSYAGRNKWEVFDRVAV